MKSVFRSDLLLGQVAFVTGGGSGICRGIARELLLHGAKAAILGRKVDRLQATALELQKESGRECLSVPADVRDPDAVKRAIDQTLERFGRIDLVVNGAAGNFLAPAAQLSPNGFKAVLDIDALGTFLVSKIAFERYLRDHGGSIINISATLHYAATPLQIHASAAKAAVDAITRTLAVEWGGLKIRVNGIAPGPIEDTEGMQRLSTEEVRARVLPLIPLGRFGRIEDVAQLAVFLASDAASYVHGATIVVDGGAWLGASARLFS